MASWFLFAREEDGDPIVSAMDSSRVEKSVVGDSKDSLIGFLRLFPNAKTFLVAKSGEADETLSEVDRLPQDSGNSINNVVAPTGTWFHLFRGNDGQPIVVAMEGARGVEAYRSNRKQNLIEFLLRHTNANTFRVASSNTLVPSGLPIWNPLPPPPPPTGQRVLLEIGHGPDTPFDPGAIAYDGRTTEYSLNVIAANAARDVIAAAGISCTITDTQGSLHIIGREASGYDVFCSIHHNAFNGAVQRTEAFSHETKGGRLDRALATLIAAEVAEELGLVNGGEKQARLGVLSGAEDTNVRAAVLAEVYFIDDAVRRPPLTAFSTRGGQAIGRAIVEWLKRNP